MLKPFARIREFFGGTVDSPGRGKEVKGSFADSRNLLLSEPSNPESSLETAYGYSTTGGLASLPTGFVSHDGTAIAPTGQIAKAFAYSSETPIAYDGRVYFVTDGSDKHVMLDSWFKGSTSKVTTPNSGFVFLDEHRDFAGGAHITVTGASVHAFTVATSNSVYKLSTTNDYYNGWIIRWYDFDGDSATQYNHYAYIVDYGYSGDTSTFTVIEDIGSGALNWARQGSADTFTLFRWFHNGLMHPTFDTPPGQCFMEGGRVRGCGGVGASSDDNKMPWNVQYINRVWFKNCSGGTIPTEAYRTYQGTYADRMELYPRCFSYEGGIWDEVGIATDILCTGATGSGDAAKTLDDGTYQVGWTLEYDGFQESMLIDGPAVTTSVPSVEFMRFKIKVHFATLSKRVTAINIYARQTVSGVQSQYHFIRRVDICNVPGPEQASWTWQVNDPTYYGFFCAENTETISQLTKTDWGGRGGTYFARTGRIQEAVTDRHIVSWKYAEIINGRLFVGNFYDPNEAQTFVDEIRFTNFGSSGASQMDCIPYDRANNEFPVASGSPDAVKGLAESGSWLVIFKDSSIHAKNISDYPETWVGYTISLRDGLASADSLVKLPNGILGFADADAFKMLVNHKVVRLTDNWRSTYGALTKTGIVSWHDKIDNSLRFVVPTERYVYVVYWSVESFPMFKLYIPATELIQFVTTERDGSVFFSNATSGGDYKWHSTDYLFGSTYVIPYFKSNVIIPDDTVEFLVDRIGIVKSGNADAGNLDNKVWIDDTQVLLAGTNPWVSQDKTMKHLFQYVTPSATPHSGRGIQVEYNTRSGGECINSAKLKLHGISIYGKPMLPLDKSQ